MGDISKVHAPHCPVTRAETRGEGAVCLCGNGPLTVRKQLGDLAPGEWFDREGSLAMWIVTNDPERWEGMTLCVRPTTGEAEQLDNSEIVYPRQRPY